MNFPCQVFTYVYTAHLVEKSGKSSEWNCHSSLSILPYTHLYFHSAFLRCVFFTWAPQKWRPRHDPAYVVLLRSALGENEVKLKSGGAGWGQKGAEQSRGLLDSTGAVEDELNTPEMVAPCCQETFFFPLSVSHSLWYGGKMGRVCCNSQARRI